MGLQNNDTFIELKLNKLQKTKHENLLDLCQKDLKKEKTIIKFLFVKLSKEKQDVEDLQKLSFTSLYHSIMGNKSEQLNIEQQEYFTAKLKFDSCQNSITALKKDIKFYQDEITKLNSNEKQAISEFNKNDKITHEESLYLQSLEKHTQLKAQKIEIQQAIKIGTIVKDDLKLALKYINSASSWGIGDMLGGGLITTAIKHSKINKSKKIMEDVKNSLAKFHRELKDINDLHSTNLDISAFDTFADYFLDGIIFDWFVQSKINKSKDTLQSVSSETDKLITTLFKKLDSYNKELKK